MSNLYAPRGRLEVIAGPMFAGKSSELLKRILFLGYSGKKILALKPVIDDRYDANQIVTHNQLKHDALAVIDLELVKDNYTIKSYNFHTIFIDEVQFFDNELVDVCNTLANQGVRVILAGLDMDFKGVPFGPMPMLLSIAEYVTKVHAVCVSCGNLAQFSHRTVEAGDQVLVGAVDKYQPLCRSCYIEII